MFVKTRKLSPPISFVHYVGKPLNAIISDTMLQKLSKCEVKAALCGHCTILPSLRFYVKLDFVDSNSQKKSILDVLNVDFSKFEQFFKARSY